MKTRTDFPRPTRVIEDARIPLPDGTHLSARIWLPKDAATNPVPALLEHLPYRKRDGTITRDELTHPYFAGHGYACIRVDMRGTGDSDGLMEDEYTQQEWDDAIAVMVWVADQPWSTGDWGMMGISWGGFNSLQVAALRPNGLRAVISLCSTSDRFADDIHYKGGCMLGENLGWAAQMLAYASPPPDPLLVGDRWRDMWLHRLNAQPFLLETWLKHQRRDGYWKHGSVCEDWDAIDIPVLAIGGWHDGYRNTPATLARNLRNAKAIVGPWNHKYPHFAGPEPRIGFLQEALRWWDRWLKDIDTGVEADARERLYVMDSLKPERWVKERPGRWVGLDNHPDCELFYLSDDHGLGQARGQLACDIRSPETCGAAGGEYFPFAYGPELPDDQTPDDAASAVFDMAHPFGQDRDIIGAPRLHMRLTPKGRAGQIAIRLCDLRPDGTSALISHGFLNLCHHKSHEHPKALTPGTAIDMTVTLDQCAYRLPKGHKLRVAISSAYWPFLWPAPENKGVTLTRATLSLPIHKDGTAVTFPPAEAAPAWRSTTLRPAGMTRDDDGQGTITITTDNGETQDDIHGLITGSKVTEVWSITAGDPLSASAEITWHTRMARGDWNITTTCTASLAASATTWHPRARIKAFKNGTCVFEKDFATDIPRDHL